MGGVNTAELIQQRLRDKLQAGHVSVADDSAQHAGHPGAKSGGHYSVTIVASAFERLNMLSRHRLVYEALGDLMKTDIHALSIRALAPGEDPVKPDEA